MKISCSHFQKCSGCQLQNAIQYSKNFEEAKLFFSHYGIHGLNLQIGNSEGWRCRARLAVRGSPKKPLIGLFKEGTHQVEDIPFCKIHHPLINQAVEVVRQWIIEEALAPYDEITGNGILRYLQFTFSRKTQKIELVVVVNHTTVDLKIFKRLWERAPELWHALWLNFNPSTKNVIFSDEWLLVQGERWLKENFLEKTIYYHPGSFMQANPEMFEKLLHSIKAHLPKNGTLIDFYAGVGAIGLSLLNACRKVVCVEVVPIAESCFKAAQIDLNEEDRKRISFHTGTATACMTLLKEQWDTIVVDPPRKGLERTFLEALCSAKHIKRLIYVSCGWESFKRDCALLSTSWKLVHAELFLFFPGTEHLEVLAIFNRLDDSLKESSTQVPIYESKQVKMS